MGCTPSKQELQALGVSAPAHSVIKLKQQLSEKARHPSAIPGSFAEREHLFRQEHRSKKAVPERQRGQCRMRLSSWGGWTDGFCVLAGHELQFFPGASPGGPSPGARPQHKWELVGAHLRLERAAELALTPAGGSPTAWLAMPSEQEAHEWMVGLAQVPGLFRRVQDYYELGAAWGRGATCMVHECEGRYNGQRYALKSRVHKSRTATEAMHNELRILQICAKKPHPAIPRLHDYFFDEEGSVELVLDLMQGGELFDHIAAAHQLRESEARDIFCQVAEGLAHLHSLGIAHRDLKPQNLMYATAGEGAQVKLMDYDLAKVNYAPDWEGGTPCGTIHYMAPEIVQHRRYTLAVDCWSLGVILYILLTGRVPFDGKDNEAIAQAIEAGQYCMDPQLWGGVSREAQDLVAALLQHDAAARPTAQQVLAHPWLTARLDPATSAELASPLQLRSTLSKTERGRRLLAQAAATFSDNDLRAAGGLPPLGRERVLAAGQALDFDMQPVRDQAAAVGSSGGPAVETPLGAAERAGHDAALLGQLRLQLQLVGTAGGVQDRLALEARGQELLGHSPRSPAVANGRHAPLAATRSQHAALVSPRDGFDDLDAQLVEEQELSGAESDGDDERGSMQQSGSKAGSARNGWAAPDGRRATLQPHPKPAVQLPPDCQLLDCLGQGGSQATGTPTAATQAQQGLRRHRSAYAADGVGVGGSGSGLLRATSTSLLEGKISRIPEEQREPVERAMQRKQRRLRRMRSASPSAHEWRQLPAVGVPSPPAKESS